MDRDEKGRWFEFFASESEKLLNYVRGRIQSIGEMDAEDIIGEVMLKIFSKAEESSPVENLAAYAYRSIRNRIVDYQRDNSRAESIVDFEEEVDLIPFGVLVSDTIAEISDEAERREILLRLSEAITALEPGQRAVLIATEIEGKSFRELSKEWRVPLGTLLSRKYRAVMALREMLDETTE